MSNYTYCLSIPITKETPKKIGFDQSTLIFLYDIDDVYVMFEGNGQSYGPYFNEDIVGAYFFNVGYSLYLSSHFTKEVVISVLHFENFPYLPFVTNGINMTDYLKSKPSFHAEDYPFSGFCGAKKSPDIGRTIRNPILASVSYFMNNEDEYLKKENIIPFSANLHSLNSFILKKGKYMDDPKSGLLFHLVAGVVGIIAFVFSFYILPKDEMRGLFTIDE